MRKWLNFAIVLLLCLAIAGATACSPGGGDQDKVNVQPVTVERADFTVSVTGSGSLEASQETSLSFGSGGTVDKIHVDEGDQVTRGQILASLETTSLEQSVRTAEQAVETAEQIVETSEHSVTAAELTVEARQQSVAAAELTLAAGELAVKAAGIDLELAQNSYHQLTTPYPYTSLAFALPDSLEQVRNAQQDIKEAQEELRKATQGEPYSMSEVTLKLKTAQESLTEAENKLAFGLGEGVKPSNIDYWTLRTAQLQIDKAQIAYDKAENDLKNLENNVGVAENNLENARNSLNIARTNLESNKTSLARAENQLDIARDELGKATITAPFDGIVASVGAKEGDRVPAPTVSPQTIIHLVDTTSMELLVEMDEIDIPEVKQGQQVLVTLDALPDAEFEGEVTAVYPLPTMIGGVVLYNTKISFDVPENSGIKVGMSASADIIINKQSDTLLVPSRAIGEDAQGNTIVKVIVNGQTQERAVVTGISDGIQTEILQGLTEGETVIIELKSSTPTDGGMFGF